MGHPLELEGAAQPAHRAREARLHRARWTVECLGHLGLRELLEVPQRDDEPIISIEAVESLDHPAALRVG